MIYPDFIKEKDTIGICAPSAGITRKISINRLEFAIKKFNNMNFKVIETSHVRKTRKGRSSTAKIRAHEVLELFLNKDVKACFSVAGGDFLMEILPFIDFNVIRENPKWIQGYSDITGLSYVIATKLDIATIYANNFLAFGMKNYHESLINNIEILKGNLIEQRSFKMYEKNQIPYEIGNEEYNLDTHNNLNIISKQKNLNIEGRIIGGCIDSISDLFGTRFDYTKDFIEKYKEDGIIWYFDNAELSNDELIRVLWRFMDNGYFKYSKCILFSKTYKDTSHYKYSYESAIKYALSSLKIPIVIDCDFGHISPRMTIINGSIAKLKVKDSKCKIKFELK